MRHAACGIQGFNMFDKGLQIVNYLILNTIIYYYYIFIIIYNNIIYYNKFQISSSISKMQKHQMPHAACRMPHLNEEKRESHQGSPNSLKINLTSAGVNVRLLCWSRGERRGLILNHPRNFLHAALST